MKQETSSPAVEASEWMSGLGMSGEAELDEMDELRR